MADSKYWSVFHDGGIVSVSATSSTDMEVFIEAPMLGECLKPVAAGFVIRIYGCQLFGFRSFKSSEEIIGVDAIADHELEILSAKQMGNDVLVTTADGQLRINYSYEELYTSDGRRLQLGEIQQAAENAFKKMRRSS